MHQHQHTHSRPPPPHTHTHETSMSASCQHANTHHTQLAAPGRWCTKLPPMHGALKDTPTHSGSRCLHVVPTQHHSFVSAALACGRVADTTQSRMHSDTPGSLAPATASAPSAQLLWCHTSCDAVLHCVMPISPRPAPPPPPPLFCSVAACAQ